MWKYLLPFLIATSSYCELVDGVAIVVKDEPITLYEISQEVSKSAKSVKEITDELIKKKLEEIEIKERNIVVSTQEVQDDLEKMAQQNNMTILQLYEAMQNMNQLSTDELKEKIKEKLLAQKLYQAISYSKMSQPTQLEKEQYYKLNISEFSYPEEYGVIIYHSNSKEKLQEKISNPMFYSADVASEEATLAHSKIDPQLAMILNQTKENGFTPLMPSPKGGFVSFFVKSKINMNTQSLESVSGQIENMIMQKKRQSVLNDFFQRLRLNSEIKVLRLP
jgi:parvulin-like peptidyl-prolyl isomerase